MNDILKKRKDITPDFLTKAYLEHAIVGLEWLDQVYEFMSDEQCIETYHLSKSTVIKNIIAGITDDLKKVQKGI